jgi:phosphoribosylformimino-5-aminoimidazole carboxamide ribonucleotide (ProFAR) isomerase
VNRAERLEIISRARTFFYRHGRGCLLHLRDGTAADEDRYSSVEEIKEALAEESDAVELVGGVRRHLN